MPDVDKMEHLRLEVEHNDLKGKYTDLRQATKLLCEVIDDHNLCSHEMKPFYRRVLEILEN